MSVIHRKSLLQLIDSLYRGGAQKVVLEIVKALPEFNHLVGYWEENKDLENEFIENQVTLVKLPFKGMLTLPRAIRFTRHLVEEKKISFIHSHMFTPNMIGRALKSTDVTTICTYHGECLEAPGIKGYLIKSAERLSINRSDKRIAVSDYVRTYIQRKLSRDISLNVIHNFGELSKNRTLRSNYLPLRVVATSNNQPYKNYPLIINAFLQLQEEPVRLDIYGSNMEPLIQLAQSLKLKNVTFQGNSTSIIEVLGNYHLYIAASDSGEGFSLSMLEAMSTGLPVICSDIPQFIEAVGDAGIVFKSRDVSDLVEKLRGILQHPEVLEIYAQKVKARSALFSREIFVKKIRDIYGM